MYCSTNKNLAVSDYFIKHMKLNALGVVCGLEFENEL